jgi:hypothetical protein
VAITALVVCYRNDKAYGSRKEDTEMSEPTMMFNGESLTLSQINAKMSELKALQSLQKEAKKAGLIVAAPKAEREKSAEYVLMQAAFAPVLSVNAEQIFKLFSSTITIEDAYGNDSISFKITDQYSVIIRDMKVAGKKKLANDAKKEAERQAVLLKEFSEYTGYTTEEIEAMEPEEVKKAIADILVEKAKLAKEAVKVPETE